MNGDWELNGDTCPTCGNPTENLIGTIPWEEETPHEYTLAERCANCGWEIKFGD